MLDGDGDRRFCKVGGELSSSEFDTVVRFFLYVGPVVSFCVSLLVRRLSGSLSSW